MSRFDQYFLMREEDIAPYLAEKMPAYFPEGAKLEVKEIGDGNLNYVYRAVDPVSQRSIIVKQAGISLRISEEMKLSTDRNRIEAEILELQGQLAEGLVPKVYSYDTTMAALTMEDLSDYSMMRYAMMRHEMYPNFADQMTTFLVNTLLESSDVVMEHKAKKELVKRFINPELCEISEDLVLTEPVDDFNGRNSLYPGTEDFVQRELYNDKALKLEMAKLKFKFMNEAQSLIHGDLHTGSIFVKPERTVVFDPEFAFYGPMGYDIGNVIANLWFAWGNGFACDKTEFCQWIEETVVAVIDGFCAKFKQRFAEKATDRMAKTEGFCDWYLGEILADTAGYTGTELLRRTVGMAKNKDLTTVQEADKRVAFEKRNIRLGKAYILQRGEMRQGSDFLSLFRDCQA